MSGPAFLEEVCVSSERGDIDVRPSHAKQQLFFDFFRCITRLAHFIGALVLHYSSNHQLVVASNIISAFV